MGNGMLYLCARFEDFVLKSVCAVEVTMYVDWTCMNVNRNMFMLE